MILASASPRRRQLLSEAGYELDVRPADVDEAPHDGESPTELVMRLASSKAAAALDEARPDVGEIVLGADTIVWLDGVELGKPADADDAKAMLRRLSGRTHSVSTGVCVLVVGDDGTVARRDAFVETTSVTFHELTDAEIDAYVASGEPMDKAGAYGIQGLGRLLVSGIEGDYFNVVGLPVARVARAIATLRGDSDLAVLIGRGTA